MRFFLTQFAFCIIILSQCFTATAAQQRFPYEAVVDAADAKLRSGPGRKYYVTNVLQQGQKVRVLRKDPGGWYMIAPPEGSFSWINAEAVETQDDRHGIVNQNNVPVQVGSALNNHHEVEQRRLSKGDVVQIIDKVNVISAKGPAAMYKIISPAGEYRWIAGRLVSPVDPQLRAQQDRDPFTVPSQLRRQKLANQAETKSQAREHAAAQQSAEQQLKELDSRFRAMVAQQKPDQWPLAQLSADYQNLLQQSNTKRFRGQVKQRLTAMNQYKKLQQEYTSYMTLTNSTSQRDAQPVQTQSTYSNTIGVQQGGPIRFAPQNFAASSSVPDPQALSGQPIPESNAFAQSGVHPTGPAIPPTPAAPASQPKTLTLSGAGIIQQAINPDVPNAQFVLLSKEGKILAFLQSARGVDLTQHIGQARGVQGTRSYHKQLQADLIVVNGLTPVELQ